MNSTDLQSHNVPVLVAVSQKVFLSIHFFTELNTPRFQTHYLYLSIEINTFRGINNNTVYVANGNKGPMTNTT